MLNVNIVFRLIQKYPGQLNFANSGSLSAVFICCSLDKTAFHKQKEKGQINSLYLSSPGRSHLELNLISKSLFSHYFGLLI